MEKKQKKINDENCKLIFLSCIIFLIEFHINQLLQSSSNVVFSANSANKRIHRHMQRVLRKFHRKKKKTHWLCGM